MISQEAAKNTSSAITDSTWTIFSCNPSSKMSWGVAFFTEFLGTLFLVLVVSACIDNKHRLIMTRRPSPVFVVGATGKKLRNGENGKFSVILTEKINFQKQNQEKSLKYIRSVIALSTFIN